MSGETSGRQRRATSQDVAATAGVSRATVSFVLNDVPSQTISESTKDAVRRAAADLGYVPSASGRSLRTGKSPLVLCLATEWEPSALMDETLSLLSRELRDAGYAVAVAKLPVDEEVQDVLWTAVSAAAVVAMFDLPDMLRARLKAMHVPVVEMYLHSRRVGDLTDDLQVSIGRAQAEHLYSAGCRHLVSVVPELHYDHGIVRDRISGAREIAHAHGLPDPEVVHTRSPIEPDSAAIQHALRDTLHDPVGVCAYNDIVAIGIVATARTWGVEAPRDFRVVGVDDDPVSKLFSTSITTVRLNLDVLNRVVVDRVRASLDLTSQPLEYPDFIELIPRQSA